MLLGADVAKGDYFLFLDSDDLWLPDALIVYKRIIGACDQSLLNWLAKSFKAESIKNASKTIRSGTPEMIFAVIRKSLTGLKIIKHNSEVIGDYP
jgi:glycosyltransferase involved in cell wall biosynthesis